ncbi:MAG TPA: ATP-binding protein, partial [bacterium]|nr:ATP-binding protein [bacterium]
IVDNLINREAIADASLWVLELFAEQAALAIINARMVARLERDKYRIQSAYRDLKDSKDKLVEAQTMAALGRMAATVAHEIRTPIVAIGGFAKRLSHDIRDRHAQRMLDIIRSEALRLEETLDMVLFYVKPSQPQRKECNVNELLETLSLYFAQEASEMHIEMVFQLDPNLPQVPLDDRQIRQVILNVIQNSIHAMQDGGILTIHTHPEGDWVVLEIIDTGCGIPEENIPSIFKEFFTTKNKGTGLGLHVSHQIVKNHGGKIEVESQMNQGTTVRIRLPLHPGPPGFEDGDDLGIVDERR